MSVTQPVDLNSDAKRWIDKIHTRNEFAAVFDHELSNR